MTQRTAFLIPVTLTFLGLVSRPAHAGDAAHTASEALRPFFTWMSSLREAPAEAEGAGLSSVKECRAAVAAARKAGLRDDAHIVSTAVSGWDAAHSDKEGNAYVTLKEAAAVCDEYEALVAMIPAAAAQKLTAQSLRLYSDTEPGSLSADMGKVFVDDGKKCLETTDSAIRAGAPADRKSKIGDRELTLTEGKKEICEAMITFGSKLTGDIKEAHTAARKEVAAKYEAVGVKGQRLELFIEYDDVYWRGKGCERVTDVKKLAKAKVLHQWLENPDGTHTIRTYKFKGNKVTSVKDRSYLTEERAWKGCK